MSIGATIAIGTALNSSTSAILPISTYPPSPVILDTTTTTYIHHTLLAAVQFSLLECGRQKWFQFSMILVGMVYTQLRRYLERTTKKLTFISAYISVQKGTDYGYDSLHAQQLNIYMNGARLK
jgi:hypothetical protein